MSGKMNWDRVRKEDRIYRRGSEWAESSAPVSQPRKRFGPTGVISQGPRMPGCSCGKPFGFKGAHKKRCALYRSNTPSKPYRIKSDFRVLFAVSTPAVVESTGTTLRHFAAAMKGIRQQKSIRSLLSGLLKMLTNDRASSTQQKRDAERAISAMLKELDDQNDRRAYSPSSPEQKP